MKILSCRIENFGKLHDFSYDFQEGCTVICAENGFGKSTLATFLRVMFYGFDGSGKRNDIENERKRYKPWQGGAYGGSLVFRVQNQTYRLTRIFGEKEAEDSFELRDAETNLPSTDYSEKIGEELFEINAESFERTVFIGQEDVILTTATDGVHAKIGNLADSTNDMDSYEKAAGRLKGFMDALTPKRATGQLKQLKARETSLKTLVRDGEVLASTIDNYNAKLQEKQELLAELTEQRAVLSKQQSVLSKEKDTKAKKEAYRRLLVELRTKESQERRYAEDFPKGLPEAGSIEEMIAKGAELERLNSEVGFYDLTPEEAQHLQTLSERFSEGVPSDDELHKAEAQIQEFAALRDEAAAKRLSSEEEERLLRLTGEFVDVDSRYDNAIAEASAMQHYLQELESRKANLSIKESNLAASRMLLETTRKQKAGKANKLALLALGLVLAFGGIALVLNGQGTTAYALLGAGLVLFALGLVLSLAGRGKAKEAGEEVSRLEEQLRTQEGELEEDRRRISEAEEQLKAYCRKHDCNYDETTIAMKLQELLQQAMVLVDLEERKKQANIVNLEARMQELETALCHFTGAANRGSNWTGTPSLYQMGVESIRRDRARFTELNHKKENADRAKLAKQSLQSQLSDFLMRLGIAPDTEVNAQLRNLQNREILYRKAMEEAMQAREEVQRYVRDNSTEDLSLSPDLFVGDALYQEEEALPEISDLQGSYEALSGQMDETKAVMQQYIKQMDELQQQYDEWEESKELLEDVIQEIADKTRQFTMAEMASEYLAQAKTNLTSRYMAPIMNAFSKYYGVVNQEETEAASYHIDANTTITKEEQGLQRDATLLSTGYRDLVGLCQRLALADAMYEGEKPMLILDDPFVNLDDRRMVGAKKLLAEVERDYQVIYFTCSESRSS